MHAALVDMCLMVNNHLTTCAMATSGQRNAKEAAEEDKSHCKQDNRVFHS